jgi:hypothetical protein
MLFRELAVKLNRKHKNVLLYHADYGKAPIGSILVDFSMNGITECGLEYFSDVFNAEIVEIRDNPSMGKPNGTLSVILRGVSFERIEEFTLSHAAQCHSDCYHKWFNFIW